MSDNRGNRRDRRPVSSRREPENGARRVVDSELFDRAIARPAWETQATRRSRVSREPVPPEAMPAQPEQPPEETGEWIASHAPLFRAEDVEGEVRSSIQPPAQPPVPLRPWPEQPEVDAHGIPVLRSLGEGRDATQVTWGWREAWADSPPSDWELDPGALVATEDLVIDVPSRSLQSLTPDPGEWPKPPVAEPPWPPLPMTDPPSVDHETGHAHSVNRVRLGGEAVDTPSDGEPTITMMGISDAPPVDTTSPTTTEDHDSQIARLRLIPDPPTPEPEEPNTAWEAHSRRLFPTPDVVDRGLVPGLAPRVPVEPPTDEPSWPAITQARTSVGEPTERTTPPSPLPGFDRPPTPDVASEPVATPLPQVAIRPDGAAPLPDPSAASGSGFDWGDRRTDQSEPSGLRTVMGWLQVLLAALVIAFVVRTFVGQAYRIPSGSMLPTLEERDRVIVNKLSYTFSSPDRGELIVFERPEGVPGPEDALIKRVLALPGETISLVDGTVYIDGRRVEESYTRRTASTFPLLAEPIPNCPGSTSSECTIPEGHVFVMGDHRGDSTDSRGFGPIDEDLVVGRAFYRMWPTDRLGRL